MIKDTNWYREGLFYKKVTLGETTELEGGVTITEYSIKKFFCITFWIVNKIHPGRFPQ